MPRPHENLATTARVPGLAGVFVLRQMKEGMQPGMGDSTVPDRAGSVFGELPGDPEAVSGLKDRLDVYPMALQVELDSVRICEDAAGRRRTGDGTGSP